MAERRFEKQQDAERNANQRKGVQAAVVHDAIDQHAPEHDRRDGGDAQNHGANREIARQPLVAQQLRQHEAEAERLVFIPQPIIALDQDDFAVPSRGEARLVEHQRGVLGRVRVAQHDNRRAVLRLDMDAHQHHRGAVAQYYDRRQGGTHLDEVCPAQPGGLGAQARCIRDTQQLLDRYLARGKLMVADQLRHREMDATLPRRDDKAAEQRRRAALGIGAAGIICRAQGRRIVQRQGHGTHFLIGRRSGCLLTRAKSAAGQRLRAGGATGQAGTASAANI